MFNLLNNFNWGLPGTPAQPGGAQETYVDFGAAAFGRILQAAGDPRIMRFGIKHVLKETWLLSDAVAGSKELVVAVDLVHRRADAAGDDAREQSIPSEEGRVFALDAREGFTSDTHGVL